MTPQEIEVAFARAIKDARLGDTVIPADGGLHRFRASDDSAGQRTGWAVLHADGAPTGVAGNWRTGERITWHPKGPVGPRELDAIREARKRRQQEDAERHPAPKNAGSKNDPRHPRLVNLSPGRVGFVEPEVDAYDLMLIAERDAAE